MATRILMVCLGNICRSPLAEGILKSKVKNIDISVESAGTAGYHIGSAPDPRSIQIAKKYGIDITDQKCRGFTKEDFEIFDYIFVMDNSNYKDVIKLAPNHAYKKKVALILSTTSLPIDEVPDPYYEDENGFEHVYDLLDIACNAIIDHISRSC
ncbi:low molecular weight protein-tyrosine-phosphatase [Leptobacterium sp. I13]|uniref:low molecular weight protein-tyrosine-phosphatase n=1 Tax=Leptobacterium meishanense TaxID=3128904 RepID=UPI0030ED1FC7